MPQVPTDIRRARAARLRDKGAAQLAEYLSGEVGKRLAILVESETAGRTPGYAQVELAAPAPSGEVISVDITGASHGSLRGERAVANAEAGRAV